MIWRHLRAGRLDVPLDGDESARFLPWIIGLMVYLSAIGSLGLVLLGDSLQDWNRSLAGRVTVEIPASASNGRLDSAVALFHATPGVLSVTPLDAAEQARLLAPWLGNSLLVQSLPVPRLIDVQVDPDAVIDFAALRTKLTAIAPGAQIDDHRLWLDRLRSFALRVETLIAVVVALVAAMTVLTVVFATRTGLAIHRPVIEILHSLGARDLYIARQFQIHAVRLGLRGGVIGVAVAAITVLILGRAAAALDLPIRLAANGILDFRVWLLLVVLPIAAGLVALGTARITVLRQLVRLP